MMIALSDKVLRLAYLLPNPYHLLYYYTTTLLLLHSATYYYYYYYYYSMFTLLRLFSINLNKSSLDVDNSSFLKLKRDERDTFWYIIYKALFFFAPDLGVPLGHAFRCRSHA
jgi:hypothetical protein